MILWDETSMKKISVAMCTYNGEKYIEEQLRSILNQTLKPDEIIVCDDNSTDHTIDFIRNLLDGVDISYTIEVNPRNIGVTRNFEKAIGLTSGEIIFLSDQDDYWYEDKIELVVTLFEQEPDCVLVFTNAELVNENRELLHTKLWSVVNFRKSLLERNKLFDILLNRSIVTGATMAIRKSLYEELNTFPKVWVHDGWLAINASANSQVCCIERPTIEYRQHESNVAGASPRSFIKRVLDYFSNIKGLALVRSESYIKYKSFYNEKRELIDKGSFNQVFDCLEFWQGMKSLDHISYIKGIIIICRQLIIGNYGKFYNGLRGAIRDILYITFYKKRGHL